MEPGNLQRLCGTPGAHPDNPRTLGFRHLVTSHDRRDKRECPALSSWCAHVQSTVQHRAGAGRQLGQRNQSVRELSAGRLTCLDPRSHQNAGLQPLLHAHAIREAERRALRSVTGQGTRSGQGALARKHTDGQLRAALLKTTLRCEGLGARSQPPSFLACFLMRLDGRTSERARGSPVRVDRFITDSQTLYIS